MLERTHAVVLSECVGPVVAAHNQAFVAEGDIMLNVVGLHEEFQSAVTKRNLQLLLLLDCTKGFNLASHSWTRRVFEKSGLPCRLRRSIYRLVERQLATLLFGGLTFAAVLWLCGYRQDGPLSGIIYIIVVASFLAALADVEGVRKVYGFCDDWEVSVAALRFVGGIWRLVCEFEAASGQQINVTKTKWLANRPMTGSDWPCRRHPRSPTQRCP